MGAIQEHGTVDQANERWVLALGFALKERYYYYYYLNRACASIFQVKPQWWALLLQ